jgi:hypothetical protein
MLLTQVRHSAVFRLLPAAIHGFGEELAASTDEVFMNEVPMNLRVFAHKNLDERGVDVAKLLVMGGGS